MLRSSGLSRPPKGRPYSIPTRRRAAARPSSPRSGLDLRRCATDEVGDLRVVDEHGVDARTLQRDDVVPGRGLEVGDRKLSGGNVGEEIEDPLDVVLVVFGIARREQKDLGVDPLER